MGARYERPARTAPEAASAAAGPEGPPSADGRAADHRGVGRAGPGRGPDGRLTRRPVRSAGCQPTGWRSRCGRRPAARAAVSSATRRSSSARWSARARSAQTASQALPRAVRDPALADHGPLQGVHHPDGERRHRPRDGRQPDGRLRLGNAHGHLARGVATVGAGASSSLPEDDADRLTFRRGDRPVNCPASAVTRDRPFGLELAHNIDRRRCRAGSRRRTGGMIDGSARFDRAARLRSRDGGRSGRWRCVTCRSRQVGHYAAALFVSSAIPPAMRRRSAAPSIGP